MQTPAIQKTSQSGENSNLKDLKGYEMIPKLEFVTNALIKRLTNEYNKSSEPILKSAQKFYNIVSKNNKYMGLINLSNKLIDRTTLKPMEEIVLGALLLSALELNKKKEVPLKTEEQKTRINLAQIKLKKIEMRYMKVVKYGLEKEAIGLRKKAINQITKFQSDINTMLCTSKKIQDIDTDNLNSTLKNVLETLKNLNAVEQRLVEVNEKVDAKKELFKKIVKIKQEAVVKIKQVESLQQVQKKLLEIEQVLAVVKNRITSIESPQQFKAQIPEIKKELASVEKIINPLIMNNYEDLIEELKKDIVEKVIEKPQQPIMIAIEQIAALMIIIKKIINDYRDIDKLESSEDPQQFKVQLAEIQEMLALAENTIINYYRKELKKEEISKVKRVEPNPLQFKKELTEIKETLDCMINLVETLITNYERLHKTKEDEKHSVQSTSMLGLKIDNNNNFKQFKEELTKIKEPLDLAMGSINSIEEVIKTYGAKALNPIEQFKEELATIKQFLDPIKITINKFKDLNVIEQLTTASAIKLLANPQQFRIEAVEIQKKFTLVKSAISQKKFYAHLTDIKEIVDIILNTIESINSHYEHLNLTI